MFHIILHMEISIFLLVLHTSFDRDCFIHERSSILHRYIFLFYIYFDLVIENLSFG
ncbi:hypothetical protein Hanom_Chr14g01321741 [Helianthus anomalus]